MVDDPRGARMHRDADGEIDCGQPIEIYSFPGERARDFLARPTSVGMYRRQAPASKEYGHSKGYAGLISRVDREGQVWLCSAG